jgi:allophanate hydrolase
LRRVSNDTFGTIDALAIPTMPTVYTVAQVSADPIQLNGRLGIYTNFVNLLDLCGLAVPASMRADGMPFGVTLLAPAGDDAVLAAIGRVFHADTALPLGAIGEAQPALAALAVAPNSGEIAVAVLGAHLSGMPLNGELRALGARLLERATTAPDYRLYALAADPPKPGLVRVGARGKAIEVEIWALPAEGFGRFVASVPSPLSIGTLRLADGRTVKGFLCEAEAVRNAQDISRCGGWRAYLAEAAVRGTSMARSKTPKRQAPKSKARKQSNARNKAAPRSVPRRVVPKARVRRRDKR